MSDTTPTFQQVLADLRSSVLGQFFVQLPAIVERYDNIRQCVDATPCIPVRVEQEDGSVQLVQMPTSIASPVLFGPITWPISKGSVVVLLYASANLSSWLALGGRSVEAPDDRRHDPSSAFALPAGHSFGGTTKPQHTAPDDALVLHWAKIRHGGSDANDPIARKSDLDLVVARLNGAIARLEGHTHPTSGGTSGTPGGLPAAAVSPLTAPACSSTSYTK